jgi:hypothetical protein
MKLRLLGMGLALISIIPGLTGCAGTKAFTTAARAGDTVALAVGWNKNVSRANLSAVITPASGGSVTYNPGDTNIRAVFNMYPDPVSRLVVGTETNQSLGYNANVHGASLGGLVTGDDKDLSQTMVLLNLPASLAVGNATVDLYAGATPLSTHTVQILSGTGSANLFEGAAGSLTAEQLRTLERAAASVVTFSAVIVPHSIYLEVPHTFGVGVPWVVNPRGDLKNVSWTDTGSVLKIVITPVSGASIPQIGHFKFYISGGLTGFGAPYVKAYDVNGSPLPEGDVTAAIQPL